MPPLFEAGEAGDVGGLEYRILRGRKADGDLIVQLRSPGGEWVTVGMAVSWLLVDLHCQVEDIIYPKARGYKGRGKYLENTRVAIHEGWRTAQRVLEQEQRAKRLRDAA